MIAVVVSPTTIRRTTLAFTALFLAGVATAILTRAQTAPLITTAVPGSLSDGTLLLANGWRLAPAGRHLTVGTLPLNLVLSPDGRYAVVTNNGVNKPTLSVIDVANWSVKTTTVVDQAWYGLAWHPDGTKLYSSGAAQNTVREFSFADGVITPSRTFTLPVVTGDTFAGGIAVSRDGRRLFVTRVFAMTLSAIDLTTGLVTKTVQLPSEPYASLVSPDGQLVYVSLWGGSAVQVYTADSLVLVGEMIAGDHPNAMALSADGRRLFVACGGSAAVWVFDTFSGEAIEQISTNLFAEAPPTSTPNSVAISPDGRSMLVANADINAVAVVDISNGARSFFEGFIPAGWYPTAAVFSRDGKQILILDGKGLTPVAANPLSGGIERRLLGAVSIVPTPDRTTLLEF